MTYQCNVPFCDQNRPYSRSYCSKHRWEFEKLKITAYKELLPLWAFKRCKKHGLLNYDQVCFHKTSGLWLCDKCTKYNKNKNYDPIKMKEYVKIHAKHRKNYALKKNHKLSLDDYEIMLKNQNGKCSICKITFEEYSKIPCKNPRLYFNVDHCHDTGKIRGLLCNRCNMGLGYFLDNPNHILNAYTYLNNNSSD